MDVYEQSFVETLLYGTNADAFWIGMTQNGVCLTKTPWRWELYMGHWITRNIKYTHSPPRYKRLLGATTFTSPQYHVLIFKTAKRIVNKKYSQHINNKMFLLLKVSGEYEWLDGWPVSYTNWAAMEPSQGSNEGCIALTVNGTWDDTGCSSNYRGICKYTSCKLYATSVIT